MNSNLELTLIIRAKNEAKAAFAAAGADVSKLADHVKKGLGKSYDDAMKQVDGLKKKFTDLRNASPEQMMNMSHKATMGLVAGLGAAAIAVAGLGAVTLKMGADSSKAYATLASKGGLVGPQLKELESSMRHVSGTVAADMGTVSDIMGQLSARTGQTGGDLEGLTKKVLTLTKVTGADANQTIAGVTRMFGDWSIATKDQSASLDKLYKASQLTGVGVDQLSDMVVKFGAPLRTMGFSFEQGVAMLGKWQKEGVNTELVMGSLRIAAGNLAKESGGGAGQVVGGVKNMAEASARLTDLQNKLHGLTLKQGEFTAKTKESSKFSNAEGIRKTTEEINKLQAAMSKGEFHTVKATKATKGLGDMLREKIKAIQDTKDQTKALDMAFELFGRRAGADMLDTIRNNKFAIDDYVKAVENSKGAVSAAGAEAAGMGGKFAAMKNGVVASISPITNLVFDMATKLVGQAVPAVGSLTSSLGDKLAGVADKLRPVLSEMIDQVGPILSKAAADVAPMIDNVVASLRDFLGIVQPSTDATKDASETLSAFGNAGGQADTPTKGLGKTVETLKQRFNEAVEKIEPFWNKLVALGDWISKNQPLIQNLAKAFGALAVLGALAGPISAVVSLLSVLGTVLSVVAGAFGAIGAAITAGVAIPLAPVLIVIGAIVAALLLMKAAWDHNLGGIQDKVKKFATDLKSFLKIDLSKLGGQIMDSLSDGFSKSWGKIKKWIDDQFKKLPQWMKDALHMKSPSPIIIAIAEAVVQSYIIGLVNMFPKLKTTVDDMMSLLEHPPDFTGQFTRFFDVLNKGSEQLKGYGADLAAIYSMKASPGSILDMLAGRGLIGRFGDDSIFQQFFGVGVQDWFVENVLKPSQEEAKVVQQIGERMANLHKIATDLTLPQEDRLRALEKEKAMYGELMSAERALEDKRYQLARAKLEENLDKPGNAKNLTLQAQLAYLDAAHEAVTKKLDDQEKAYNRIADAEARWSDAVLADYELIKQAIEEARDAALDAEDQVHEAVLKRLEEEMSRREGIHERIMARIAARRKAEDEANRQALADLDYQAEAIQKLMDADDERLEELRHKLKVLEHDAAQDPVLKAAKAAVEDLDKQIIDTQTTIKETVDLFKDLERIDPRDSAQRRADISKKKREVIGLSQEQRDAVNARLDEGIYDLSKREQRVLNLLNIGKKVNADEVEALLKKLGLTGQGDPDNSPQVKALQAERQVQQDIVDKRQEEIKKLQELIAEEEFQAGERARAYQSQLDAIEAKRKLEDLRHAKAIAGIEGEEEAEQQRWTAEKARIEEAMSLEDERHNKRMKQLQDQYAYMLMMAGMKPEEVEAELERIAKRAKEISDEAQAAFEKWLARINATSSGTQTPVAPGAPIALPPGGVGGTPPPGPPGGPINPFRLGALGYGATSALGYGGGPGTGYAPVPTSSSPSSIVLQGATLVIDGAKVGISDAVLEGDLLVGQQNIRVQVGEKLVEEIIRSGTANQAAGKDERTGSAY